MPPRAHTARRACRADGRRRRRPDRDRRVPARTPAGPRAGRQESRRNRPRAGHRCRQTATRRRRGRTSLLAPESSRPTEHAPRPRRRREPPRSQPASPAPATTTSISAGSPVSAIRGPPSGDADLAGERQRRSRVSITERYSQILRYACHLSASTSDMALLGRLEHTDRSSSFIETCSYPAEATHFS